MKSSISRRTFIGGAGLMGAAAALAGCGGGAGSGSGDAAAKGSVYWLNFKPEVDEVLQELAADYKKAKGVDVKVVTAASGTYDQTLTSEMDKSEPPTLFVIGTADDLKQWGDYALDLTDTEIAKQCKTDDYNLYDADKKLKAIGYCYECFGIIVNKDLVEKAGHKVEDITNFDTLKAVVEDIHKRAAELGFDAFTASDMDDSSSWRFTGHMTNADLYYEEQDDGGWTTTPASIKGTYLPNYKNLYDLCINNSTVEPTTLATGGHDPENEFIEGKAAFFVNGSWEFAKVADKVKNSTMIPYYCGVKGEEKAGLNAGTENCWAVNANASEENQKATLDFMLWLASDKDASKKLVDALGIMPFTDSAESTNQYLLDAQSYTEKGNYVMNWAFNYQPNVDEYRKGLVSALNDYNNDQSDANWDKVKTAFVEGWAQQYAAANK